MSKSSQYMSLTLGSLLLSVSILTGCGNSSQSSVNSPNIPNNQTIILQGAGATFPAPLYQKWISEYTSERDKKNVQIKYNSVGSGAGVKNFLEASVDFGATDAPLKVEEKQQFPQNRGKPIQIPMTGGLIVFAYNLSNYEGLDNLKLSRKTYCDIVTGKITKWNDPAIAKDNPNVRLPQDPLIFVHREDGSGTTFIFTSHIEKACSDWKSGSGKKVEWPTGLPAQGNEGVSTQIQQTPGAIGYIEYSYSKDKGLQTAVLQNKAGNFINPSPENASKAFTGSTVPQDFALVIPDTEAPQAYPIVGLTWLLLYTNNDETKAEVLKNFVQWSLTQGDESASELGYLPIPDDLQEKVITTLNNNL